MKMKYIIICMISFLLLTSCENKNQKFQKEYEELIKSYPDRFANGNAVTIYNVNKEYILRPCFDLDTGFGIELHDLSKLDIEHKVYKLRMYKLDNRGWAEYEWLNDYVHEVIDNYVKYGETFLLIKPNNQQYPNPAKK